MIRRLTSIAVVLFVAPAAAEPPQEVTDPSDRATFAWLLEGLEHLVKLGDQIGSIDLGNTVVPPADVERLRRELPHARIEHEPIGEMGKLIVDNWKDADRKLRKWAPGEVIDAYVAAAEIGK